MSVLVAYLAVVCLLGFPRTAHAYIDPGAGSLLLQSIAFVFLIAGASFRQVRDFAQKCLLSMRRLRQKR
jgi:hypothetical protein